MAAPECEREARKRRERRDSGSAHERKERRPHSEERLPPPPPPPPLHDYNRLESERRAERLSRARRPQHGGKRRRPPVRVPKHPKENDWTTIDSTEDSRCSTPPHYEFAVLQQKPQAVCDEPETLDAGALQRQVGRTVSIETNEDSELAASARAAAAERARRDERSVASRPHPRRDQPGPDNRLEKINKKIAVLKKNIAKYESEYEAKHGHAISASDRMTDVQLTRMNETLRRLQAEKKCIKADPVEYALKVQAAKLQKERDDKLEDVLNSEKPMADVVRDIEEMIGMLRAGKCKDVPVEFTLDLQAARRQKDRDDQLDCVLKSGKSMAGVVKDIEKWLEGCRQATGRATIHETTWSAAQLAAEKLCVQKVLLRLEAARGRPPAHSADRGAARHLYERYRAVKRALATSRPDAVIGGTNGELATIHEHEPMLFNTSVDSSSDSQEKPSEDSQETVETPLQSPPTRDSGSIGVEEVPSSTSSAQSATTSEEATPSNEGLHCLGLEDLARALAEAKLQKCVLRRSIKDYEVSFELQNSRKVQRDDKKGREEEYLRYKVIKARIKLLNALINKQKALGGT